MLSIQLSFLYYVLPICLAVYWLVPPSRRPLVLAIASRGCYAGGEGLYVLLLLGMLANGSLAAWQFGRGPSPKTARKILIGSLAVDLGLLVLMKYGGWMGLPLRPALGMSLYTLQVAGYTLEAYQGRVAWDRNPTGLMLYAAGMPWLAVGPMPEYTALTAQLSQVRGSVSLAADGVRRLIQGLAKELLLADSLGSLCEAAAQAQGPSVLLAWMYGLGAALRLYFMLSGLSDLAIGLSQLFGLTLPENFDHPFAAASLREFWRRSWQTVGRWFVRYVCRPLMTVFPRHKALCLVGLWLILGLWQGDGWQAILWGLFNGLLLVGERTGHWSEKAGRWGHLYVVLAAVVGGILLNGPDLPAAGIQLGHLIGLGGIPLCNGETLYLLRSFAVPLVLAALWATPLPAQLGEWLRRHRRFGPAAALAEPFILAALLLVCTAFLVSDGALPIPYGRF